MRFDHRSSQKQLWLMMTAAVLATVIFSGVAAARITMQPAHSIYDVVAVDDVALFRADRVDAPSLYAEDVQREREGLPVRFALPQSVFIAPDTHGTWEELPGSLMAWRLRITSLDAVSLNLGFTRYMMPAGGYLSIYPIDGTREPVTFTAADNKDHGELWTPILETGDMMIEVVVPTKARWDLELELTSLNVGYKEFGNLAPEAGLKQGTCNNDVVCPEGDGWREDIQTVAAYSTGGSIFCTGAMINNTSNDGTPYFLTAYHCGIGSGNDSSLVVYWNFHSVNCGDLSGGPLTMFQTGSTFRAGHSTSDFTLVQLDAVPAPAHMVAYAGWDRSGVDASSAVAIHHPNGDEKAISFENDPTTVTTYLSNTVPGNGTHVRITDWDSGTTEPGSSGSPLYDQNHRIIGQLHGGYAACGNNSSDWYGRFFTSWTGGGSSASRLSNWLDPAGTGATTLDLIAPYASGMSVSAGNLSATGDMGGPFTPTSKVYTLENRNDTGSINFTVGVDVAWVDLSTAAGTIPAGGSTTVTVSLNPAANSLTIGSYSGIVSFVNATDGEGDATRGVDLTVGVPTMIYSWNMDVNPGWTPQGQWAYGVPTGGGGEHGNNDPTSGATGAYVYGYNLAGDYANNLPETHLTTTAIDCAALTAVSLKFMRYLNVEQPQYDHAYIRISTDGVAWTTVWENGGEITDNAWTPVEIDISAIADNQSTVYVRWTMGVTDSSWLFSGWNLDDVEIWGLEPISTGTEDEPGTGATPAAVKLHDVSPNPFNPLTKVAFDMPRGGNARLAVYDVRGHLVRVLHDGALPAGLHTAVWDGTDDTGRAMSSGNYLFRLVIGNEIQTRKAALVR